MGLYYQRNVMEKSCFAVLTSAASGSLAGTCVGSVRAACGSPKKIPAREESLAGIVLCQAAGVAVPSEGVASSSAVASTSVGVSHSPSGCSMIGGRNSEPGPM